MSKPTSGSFDPYYNWLGIPPGEQPPSAYRLLGLRPFESNAEVIQNAVDRQTLHLRTYQLGDYSDISQRLLNEVAAARSTLLDTEKKAAYDRKLQAESRPATQAAKIASPGQPVLLNVPRPSSPSPLRPLQRRRLRRFPTTAVVSFLFVAGLIVAVYFVVQALSTSNEPSPGFDVSEPPPAVQPAEPVTPPSVAHPAKQPTAAEPSKSEPQRTMVIESKTLHPVKPASPASDRASSSTQPK